MSSSIFSIKEADEDEEEQLNPEASSDQMIGLVSSRTKQGICDRKCCSK